MPELHDIAETLLRAALRGGAEDVIVEVTRGETRQLRFSNNQADVLKRWDELEVSVFLAKGHRVIEASADVSDPRELERWLRRLLALVERVAPSEQYRGISKGPFEYAEIPASYDPKVIELDDDSLVSLASKAIDRALELGAERCAGTLYVEHGVTVLRSSAGAAAQERFTKLSLSLRAFRGELSGHGVAVSRTLASFKPREAADMACRWLSAPPRRLPPVEGRLGLLLAPMAAATLLGELSWHASAFSVDAGLSAFCGRLGQRVASELLSIKDDPWLPEGLFSTAFDEEGHPTRPKHIIERGILRTLLYNTSLARKHGVESTGNAGIIEPHPWNLVVEPGDHTEEELLRELDRGYVVTSIWYTRYANVRAGDFSTLPRDTVLYVEHGEPKGYVKGIRMSDNLLRLLRGVRALGRRRYQIYWWETPVPVLTPAILISEAGFTKPQGASG